MSFFTEYNKNEIFNNIKTQLLEVINRDAKAPIQKYNESKPDGTPALDEPDDITELPEKETILINEFLNVMTAFETYLENS